MNLSMLRRRIFRLPHAALFLFCALSLLAGAAPASASSPAQARTLPQENESLQELADRITGRAAFIAELLPRLTAAGFTDDATHPPWTYTSRTLGDALWKLRGAPEILAREEAKLFDAKTPAQNRERGLTKLVRETEYRALRLYGAAHGQPHTRLFREEPRKTPEERVRETLRREQLLQPYLLFVMQHQDPAEPSYNEDGLLELWKARNQPERFVLVREVLRDKALPLAKKNEIAALATDDLAAARALYARAPLALKRERLYAERFRYSSQELLTMPAFLLAPDGLTLLEKPGLLPLAAKPAHRENPALSRRSLPELFPTTLQALLQVFSEKNDTPMPDFPLLKPGETLFLLRQTRDAKSLPIFRATPLQDLATVGPRLLPYSGEDNKRAFFRFFSNPFPSREGYLIAAACTRQELAAHLASLAVLHGAPERSLYGPANEYAVTLSGAGDEAQLGATQKALLEAARLGLRLEAVSGEHQRGIPRDYFDARAHALLPDYQDRLQPMPRLARVESALFFDFLASLADGAGLARLMGPVRAVWHYEGRAPHGAWKELRYEPPARQAAGLSAPGAAPLLSLDRTLLERLNEMERQTALAEDVSSFAGRFCRQKGLKTEGPECGALVRDMRARALTFSAELAGYGIKAPGEQRRAILTLIQLQDSTVLPAARAMLKNSSKSPKERLAELREMAKPELKRIHEEYRLKEKEQLEKEREEREKQRGAKQKKSRS